MKKKSNLKKLISYYKPYKRLFWTDMFFATVSAAVALTIPLIVRYIAYNLVYEERAVILHTMLYLGAGLLLLVAIDCYSRFYIGNYGHVMGAKIEYDMRAEIFAHMQKLSFSFYDDAQVGQLMSRITTDLFDITELLHHGPENIILSVIKIAGALVILVNINWMLAIAAFVMVPIMFFFASKLYRKMRRASRRNRQKIAEINAQIEDNLSGIRVVKSFANEEIENQKFQKGNDGFLESKKNSYHYMGMFQAGMAGFTTLIQVCVLVTGAVLIAYGRLQVQDLITFMLYISVFTEPVRTLVDFTEQFQNGYTGFERFREIMDTKPDIVDAKDAKVLTDVKGDICFDHVSFAYQENQDEVLNEVSLNVPAGAYMALVGSSGAGKTTLCSLIPRFYETTGGNIYIDGHNIKEITLKSLRDNIGIVQQDVYLFAGTIYENISYGKPGATREEVIAAAKNANAHDFIMSFPDGYDTDIGQRGIKLSGGQKQRLSIARVFLKNPPILIFDEATSALDNESERVVQESLEKLAKNRTTFVIAHRLTTIQNAERILVLTENGIAESGSHDELLAKGGIYEKLYHMHA
ncbi:ABC transporter ATP-binding protein [Agathobacter ruminis]|uniref:Thiamine ABC transporter permease n=1 Tax=Agathobacter ruminis TaxID=1712665 RepID=A0A2G3E294_9FIRM|nr:ABC transporter ATP-binding protein [Agathobacter ruminis]MDC7300844.1 ABC transporter ATP-binding protein/permease [Agathobacter ruminis]PHU37392.1 thiamine ABC transporter permease [Agathobacter ruminis]